MVVVKEVFVLKKWIVFTCSLCVARREELESRSRPSSLSRTRRHTPAPTALRPHTTIPDTYMFKLIYLTTISDEHAEDGVSFVPNIN